MQFVQISIHHHYDISDFYQLKHNWVFIKKGKVTNNVFKKSVIRENLFVR